jgi:tRNA/rRNA methyltransferase
LKDIHVLLSRIEGAVNLGFIARSMANTGFSSLSYIGTVSKNNKTALKYALTASDILASARHADSFRSLVSDSDVVIAFTPRDPFTAPPLAFEDLKSYVEDTLADGLSVGLMFGNEAHGLNNEEISLCTKRVSLPTSENFPSMNLAQAVMVVLWELRKSKPQKKPDTVYADCETIDILRDRLNEYLELIEYFNKQNPAGIRHEINHMIQRGRLTKREAELLLSIISKSISRHTFFSKSK